MLSWWSADRAKRRKAQEIYGAVVAQARHPRFYACHGIPDTPEGRYEMIVLHLFLVLEHLRRAGSAHEELSRMLIETFVTDMDDAMRELGVGDLTVPRKVKAAAAGFYSRSGAYRTALDTLDTRAPLAAIVEAMTGSAPLPDRAGLERYLRSAFTALQGIPAGAVGQAPPAFPEVPVCSPEPR